MIYALQNQNQKEQACYVRFFNGAIGLDTADIFVNDQLVVEDLRHGTFSNFRMAKPGAYKVEVKIHSETSDTVFTELVSLMEDTAYTIVLTGNADHLSLVVVPLDLRHDIRLPNIRFANTMPYDSVIDIDINGHSAVDGLMYQEISDNIEMQPGNHYVTIYDANSQKILEDGFTIAAGKNYLGIIVGTIDEPENLPALFVAEDMPVL
ncbi:MAG: DUF4397 domain-containing protein [Defluviitaleaceae bacterium]|nr:DUF4397 domain-containing protein [Defluviitaleaceae bacterium]